MINYTGGEYLADVGNMRVQKLFYKHPSLKHSFILFSRSVWFFAKEDKRKINICAHIRLQVYFIYSPERPLAQ